MAKMGDPVALKYLLAPVVTKSKAEQERFYTLFDQYYAEVFKEAEQGDLPELELVWWKRVRNWVRGNWRYSLAILLALGGLVFILKFCNEKPKLDKIESEVYRPKDIYHLQGDRMVYYAGDTAAFSIRPEKEFDTIYWTLYALEDSIPILIKKQSDTSRFFHWPVNNKFQGEELYLDFRVDEKLNYLSKNTSIQISCDSLPFIIPEVINGTTETPATFMVYHGPKSQRSQFQNLIYEFSFGDGTQSTLDSAYLKHQYAKAGDYQVRLSVYRSGNRNRCSFTKTINVNIQEEKIQLPLYALEYLPQRTRAVFGPLIWALLGILALGVMYWFWRWAKTQRPVPPKGPEPSPPVEGPQAPDRGPYDIPFQNNNGLIRPRSEQLRLAEALRRRQEDQVQYLDLPRTLEASIESGGFPNLRYRSSSKTADYLFLVDEQSENSHLGRLLRRLAAVLQEQEAASEVFFYRKELFQFWNAQYPQGLSLEQLGRLCPDHRLVIVGDGLSLLDPYALATQALRPDLEAGLRRWARRLLLTPRPPLSWDHREAALYGLLPLYPADLAGQLAAANFIANGMAAEDLPPQFATWRENCQNLRIEPDVDRRWRDAADHRAYFGAREDLYAWLCAIALHPQPTWELSLAIGAALGIAIDHDTLLILSRVPWLQDGRLSPRLRRELLADLDEHEEALAREAIVAELEAAAAEAEGSFAQHSLENNLAVQRFVLAPYDADAQAAVKLRIEAGQFSKWQVEEMGAVAAKELQPPIVSPNVPRKKGDFRQQQVQEQMEEVVSEGPAENANFSNFNLPPISRDLPADENTLKQFLAENQQEQEKAPEAEPEAEKPVTWNREARILMVFLWLLLLLGGAMWKLESTEQLFKMAFGTGERTLQTSQKMQGNWLVRERLYVDSSVIYNNQVAEEFNKIIGTSGEYLLIDDTQVFQQSELDNFEIDLKRANELRTPFLLESNGQTTQHFSSKSPWIQSVKNVPLLNLAKIYYTASVVALKNVLNKQDMQTNRALNERFFKALDNNSAYFLQYDTDSLFYEKIRLAALHGLGLQLFYQGNGPQSEGIRVDSIFNVLNQAKFFDTIAMRPNLATLLGREQSRILGIDVVTTEDNSLSAQINYYRSPREQRTGLRLRLSARASRDADKARIRQFLPPVELPLNNYDQATTMRLYDRQPNDKRLYDTYQSDTLLAEIVQIQVSSPVRRVLSRFPMVYAKSWNMVANREQRRIEQDFNEPQRIRVRLSDGMSGEYLTGISATLTPSDRPSQVQRVQSNAEGWLDFGQQRVRNTVYTLRINAPGYRPYQEVYDQVKIVAASGQLPEAKLYPDNNQQTRPGTEEKYPTAPLEPEMVQVPAGSFMMGCEDGRDKDCGEREKPAHRVTLDAYYLGKYEVMVEEYLRFADATRSHYPEWLEPGSEYHVETGSNGLYKNVGYSRQAKKLPIAGVSWEDAVAYVAWLSKETGKNYRLPTEAEWEFAARGGEKGALEGMPYAGSDKLDQVGWYDDNSGLKPHEVGRKRPNQLGIYDMSGNLWEWCQDWSGEYFKANQRNPKGPASGSDRVLRGGSWIINAELCRVAFRYYDDPQYRFDNYGFRVVRLLQ